LIQIQVDIRKHFLEEKEIWKKEVEGDFLDMSKELENTFNKMEQCFT